jgi:hypothetical protein
MGGRVDARGGSERLSGSAAEGKWGGERWGSRAWGCHTARGCRGAWPRPAVVAWQQPEHGARGRRAPCARVPAGQSGEREDGQVGRGTVPGGGATNRWGRPISGAVESAGARGPAREESGVGRAQMNSKVLHLFELV